MIVLWKVEIGNGVYLGCFLPGGSSAHDTIIQSNQQAYIKGYTLKRGSEGKDSHTIIAHCCDLRQRLSICNLRSVFVIELVSFDN